MTREDIIRMARESGFGHFHAMGCRANAWGECDMGCDGQIERFAALVAAAEREACARVCEETTASWTQQLYNEGCMDCARAIRARGNDD